MGSAAPLQPSCFHNSLAWRRTNVRQWAGVLWIVRVLRVLRLFSGVARIREIEAGLSASNAVEPNPSRYPLLDLRATLAVLPRTVWTSRSLHCRNTIDDPARTFAWQSCALRLQHTRWPYFQRVWVMMTCCAPHARPCSATGVYSAWVSIRLALCRQLTRCTVKWPLIVPHVLALFLTFRTTTRAPPPHLQGVVRSSLE